MSVVALGDNCIDRYAPPIALECVGGQAVNVASDLCALGARVAYGGAVGSDAAAAMVLADLRGRGVDVSLVEQRDGATGVTIIGVSADGDRRFLTETYGVSAPYRPGPAVLAAARRADLVYGVHLVDLTGLRSALPRPITLALDASEEPLEAYVAADPDVLFVSRPAFDVAAARALASDLAVRANLVAVVTLGESGAVAAQGDEARWQAAEPGPVIDTLGAGDALAAGFLWARSAGAGLAEALGLAGRMAARVCAHHGGWLQPADVEA